ncbi:AAA family ATPase [Pseudoalteromonas denitrificans]|uniref:MoxR-like ATPase n=1 Tax=Pseudoalteromonas denitrificans DSM 6059 TaxID=1123010 RepID=A0A1I1FZK0_9GAMM|nr:MoxR family ATPase [Pseudoalteromonas denitrificans]SFC04794.1 MoxR-like ATPase [Pseudoalteromonas denitrificans DSM 6059]
MNSIINSVLADVSSIIFGKEKQIKLSISCLLAQGHLLIEDLPGMGKTSLSHALAVSLGLSYQRIQFTSDLLPSDILGTSIFDTKTQAFSFHKGPLFSQVVLADEINRAGPKTQSALLEAMEEKQVSIDGHSYLLPQPFFVIATQNPIHQAGTYPLPESQLDRFLMRITLGYPGMEAERKIILGMDNNINSLGTRLTENEFSKLQEHVKTIKLSDPVIDYVLALVNHSRLAGRYPMPLSPRASIALTRAAQAWAFIDGRDFVTPDDVQMIFPSVVEHRLNINSGIHQGELAQELLKEVKVPV